MFGPLISATLQHVSLNRPIDHANIKDNAAKRIVSRVEDEGGQSRRVYAYPEPTEQDRASALEGMKAFQKKVQKSFDEQDVTEDDLDQLLQEDD